MTVIEIENLYKSFDHRRVLDGICLKVEKGDIFGFLGPNGAGKTTTLRILLGLLERDGGRVSVLGMDSLHAGGRLRGKVNALPESHGLYGWMSASEYLKHFAGLYDVPLADKKCVNRLEMVGLDPGDNRPVGTYSHGMKQRLGIARALMNDPEILFLDEPTNGLDPEGRRHIHDLLLKLNKVRGTTVVLSTHILDDVERLCNKIAILYKGKIRYEGSVSVNHTDQALIYRCRLENEAEMPLRWAIPGISVIERKNDWITCRIEGMKPSEAVKRLVYSNIPVTEFENLSAKLESLYLSSTQEVDDETG